MIQKLNCNNQYIRALYQSQTCRPPPLTFDQPFMDAQKADLKAGSELHSMGKNNKKNQSFLFLELRKVHQKFTIFRTKMTKNDHSSKNKNLKLGFFYSADGSFFM